MLNCFFGAELKPDGVARSFTVPKGTSLVLTQCSVTSVVPPLPSPADATDSAASGKASPPSSSTAAPPSAAAAVAQAYSPVTLCVQGHGLPTRFAVCTLSPAQQITYCPLQLLFSKPVSFVLVPQQPTATGASPATATSAAPVIGKKTIRNAKQVPSTIATAVYPTVHLTGYYERAADEDDDDDDGAMARELMEHSEDEEGE